jgi:hypothetical protein
MNTKVVDLASIYCPSFHQLQASLSVYSLSECMREPSSSASIVDHDEEVISGINGTRTFPQLTDSNSQHITLGVQTTEDMGAECQYYDKYKYTKLTIQTRQTNGKL